MPDLKGADRIAQRMLVWVDMNGKEDPIPVKPDAYVFPRISPDGTRVAITKGSLANASIWVLDLASANLTRLTNDPLVDICPLWTPDGKRIAFFSAGEGRPGIYWKPADGTGRVEPIFLVEWDRMTFPSSWSGKDEKGLLLCAVPELDSTAGALAFSAANALMASAPDDLRTHIQMLTMEGDRKVNPLMRGTLRDPRISPDGRWMAYVSSESGRHEVYVRPFPDVHKGWWQVSAGGGDSPLWSPDGRELFYHSAPSFMAADVETEPVFKPGKSRVLFQGPYLAGLTFGNQWDISPDGERFLMMKEAGTIGNASAEDVARPRIHVVLNWFEELKQRVPTHVQ